MSSAHPVWLGLGANLGDRAATLRWAVARLRHDDRIDQLRASRIWRGPYVGPLGPQPEYFNLCVSARAWMGPGELLALVRGIEREAGRAEASHEVPRVLDIDVLLFDTLVFDGPDLVLPHPRMRGRRFVLEPLAELDPDLALPPDGATVASLLGRASIAAQELAVVPDDGNPGAESGGTKW